MGLFSVEVSISNYERPERQITLKALVNESKFMSVLPSSVLRELGVTPISQQNIRFPDGIVRRTNIGLARVQIDDQRSPYTGDIRRRRRAATLGKIDSGRATVGR